MHVALRGRDVRMAEGLGGRFDSCRRTQLHGTEISGLFRSFERTLFTVLMPRCSWGSCYRRRAWDEPEHEETFTVAAVIWLVYRADMCSSFCGDSRIRR